MNLPRCALLVGLLLISTGLQPAAAQPRPWSTATAYTIPAGTLEAGLLQPVRYGFRSRIELSTSLSSLVSPGIEVKIGWGRRGSWRLASQHSINYPTPLLRLVSREGIGGMLPPATKVPHLLSLRSRVLVTRALARRHWITVDAGIRWALWAGDHEMTTLDLPILYPRTASFQGDPVLQVGGRLDGYGGRALGYALGGNVFFVTGAAHLTFEQTGLVIFRPLRRFAPFAGYRWISGGYPFGVQRHVLPLAGFRWVLKAPRS